MKINTVLKGDEFENRVFNLVYEELKNDNFIVQSKTSSIFQKKKYYSKDRDKYITTDISIETRFLNYTEYSLLIVIECKNYNNSIQVSEVEEFHSKIQQIAGDNVKGIFITNAELQLGALNYAQSKKMAVIRILPDNHFKGVTYSLLGSIIGAFAGKIARWYYLNFRNEKNLEPDVIQSNDFYTIVNNSDEFKRSFRSIINHYL